MARTARGRGRAAAPARGRRAAAPARGRGRAAATRGGSSGAN